MSDSKKTFSDLRVVRRWVGNSEHWLKQLLERAPSIPSIVSIVVMGSAVRDRSHRRSDFDLLILYRDKRPSLRPPLEVDIRMYPMANAAERLREGHEIIGWAMQFGIDLYDPENVWKSLRTQFANRVPLPSAAEAIERGQKSRLRAHEMLSIGDESAADDLVLAAATQFVRADLINHGVFPASRPELPDQLRQVSPGTQLANILDDAMYGDAGPQNLLNRLDAINNTPLAAPCAPQCSLSRQEPGKLCMPFERDANRIAD
jgi:hypothetical protein